MKMPPCKGCTKRYLGCHDKCKGEGSYQEWKAEFNALIDKDRAIRKAQHDVDEQRIQSYYKRKKKRRI